MYAVGAQEIHVTKDKNGDSSCMKVSLVAQLVKTLPAMQETWVQSLVWEDPLEKGNTTHSTILA